MRGPRRAERRRFWAADLAVATTIAAVVVILGLAGGGTDARSRAVSVTIDPQAVIRRIPGSFVGLSLEYRALEAYAGTDPERLDPIFVQLIRDLAPGQRPHLRIGGDSADWTWWPLPGMSRPPGVTFSLDQRWIE